MKKGAYYFSFIEYLNKNVSEKEITKNTGVKHLPLKNIDLTKLTLHYMIYLFSWPLEGRGTS